MKMSYSIKILDFYFIVIPNITNVQNFYSYVTYFVTYFTLYYVK